MLHGVEGHGFVLDFFCTVPPQHVQHHGVCTDGIELRGIQDPLAHDGGVVLNCRDERNLL
ncbi:Uncharacterised protein [Mycobacterium tuberculosis]|uniref:Uncharacterized protein n=1 Tax=Mycobacterium tuberculosis TaxID=1773 RepID=A0A0U0TKT7_MYCTX|nr:Uncharacterised protein [Mycobacterium tuberculosis]CFE51592.1 Uncharacterised protein [Mycobacterium tuberculosis]CKS09013.1 Uncharacterised protein [Mycobacterium tuberculosis]CKS80597.1 Uncharacterised protein [Mycobacterium tuberculosis]COW62173.1 Uncharacterised protein [Mycobacterium tuberculosis]